MTTHNHHTAQIFEEAGLLSSDEITSALDRATEYNTGILQVLIERGHSASDLLNAVAAHCGMERVVLTQAYPPASAASLINEEAARRYHVVPLEQVDGRLTLAIGNPLDIETIDTLHYIVTDTLNVVAALPDEIDKVLDRLYPTVGTNKESQPEDFSAEIDLYNTPNDDEPIINLVNLLIMEGYRQRASDIHIEPLSRDFRIRYRIDGALREVEGPPRRLHPAIISRLKIMAGMKISDRRLPQDGRIEINVKDRTLDLRVSSIPTNHGESMVMRILDKKNLLPGLPHLGFYPEEQKHFERLIHYPDGLLLITGPTGSGKTTSLYACLNHLNKPDRKIITVEDPVEYQLSGINQVHVRTDIGMTFSAALRAMLRQAPNIIMIGEIRDRETADIAVNAALTGHLVLSTLHTNDAPSAITRLTDIGIKPFLSSSSIRGVLAQRLVRSICTSCKSTHTPTVPERSLLGSVPNLYHGTGCSECGETGYYGRTGIFELLSVNDDIRQLIYSGAPATELRKAAQQMGMRSLRDDGLRKAADGVTTVDEVLRVTMGDNSAW